MFQIYINGGRDNASKLQIRQWGRDPICFEARPGRVLWFAGVNFTNSIMRIRLLTRLSNASVRISEKKKIALEIFAFPETDDYCRPPRTEESLQQPFAADEIVLPLICIIQRARERWIGFYRAWNRACSRKGWWERVELRSTEEFMDRRKKRGSKCKCTRFAVKFHFFFFFSFSYFPSFLSLGFFLQSRRNFEGGKVDCKTELSLV